jgi:hypothetical protein
MKKIIPYYLLRKTDVNGVSGTGVVGLIAKYPDGTCVLQWLTYTSSIGVYKSLEDLIEVHNHGGATVVVEGDPPREKTKRSRRTAGK